MGRISVTEFALKGLRFENWITFLGRLQKRELFKTKLFRAAGYNLMDIRRYFYIATPLARTLLNFRDTVVNFLPIPGVTYKK